MVANRSRDTGPELALRKALWRAGLRGYRVHRKELPGTPDVVFSRRKLAIFVHGCWWHGCPHCGRYRVPKANSEYWIEKLRRNRQRDERAVSELMAKGYEALIVWECDVKFRLTEVVDSIQLKLG